MSVREVFGRPRRLAERAPLSLDGKLVGPPVLADTRENRDA